MAVDVLVATRPVETATTTDSNRGPGRLLGLDALRGLAIVGMLLVDNRGSSAMPSQFVHTTWNGLHIADVVFPVFLFAVGMSMEMSSRTNDARAVAVRALKLVLIGFVLVAAVSRHVGLSAGVLQHIAAAYVLCWLILRLPRRAQTPTALGVLAFVFAAYTFVHTTGVTGGYASGHTIGEWFTVHVLHLSFSAETPQSYLPSAISVYFGVLAARHLRTGVRPVVKLAAACTAAGLALMPFVPLNKRLWTPSYTLLTAGIAAGLFVALHLAIDGRGLRFAPLVTLGRNAVVVFAFSELVFRAALADVRPLVVSMVQAATGPTLAAVTYALLSIVAAWALTVRLERRGVAIRI